MYQKKRKKENKYERKKEKKRKKKKIGTSYANFYAYIYTAAGQRRYVIFYDLAVSVQTFYQRKSLFHH